MNDQAKNDIAEKRRHSTLSAVVLKWSRARNRYERQGLMVEEQALEKAEEECLADSEGRDLTASILTCFRPGSHSIQPDAIH